MGFQTAYEALSRYLNPATGFVAYAGALGGLLGGPIGAAIGAGAGGYGGMRLLENVNDIVERNQRLRRSGG